MKRNFEHIYGCLIGSAIGDAMGAPVEFMSFDRIVNIYGEEGITSLQVKAGQTCAEVTDDTQLILFTAEALIRSATRAKRKQKERTLLGSTITLFRAYQRWLHTQGLSTVHWKKKDYDGWLVKVGIMQAYREPGVTCLTALGKGVMGTLDKPLNSSKGCGSLVRVIPIGLIEEEERAFLLGKNSAAITHGAPCTHASAGALALIIHYIIEGDEIELAIDKSIDYLKNNEEDIETVEIMEKAVKLAREGDPSRENIELLGKGFDSHEALAMGIYATLSHSDNIELALKLAINHSGDSDSVGAITGGILGAYYGASIIPDKWIELIELKKEIKTIAEDLDIFYTEDAGWLEKYPAW